MLDAARALPELDSELDLHLVELGLNPDAEARKALRSQIREMAETADIAIECYAEVTST
jgi:hypothetical protein